MLGHSQRFVVPVDGGSGDERVLSIVHQLADHQPISLTIIYVVEVVQSIALDAELPEDIARGESVLRAAEMAARSLGAKGDSVVAELLQARAAGAAIVDEAVERGADTIVMAARNRRLHGRTTVGETVDYVMKNAPCEVLVIRLAPDGSGGREWR